MCWLVYYLSLHYLSAGHKPGGYAAARKSEHLREQGAIQKPHLDAETHILREEINFS